MSFSSKVSRYSLDQLMDKKSSLQDRAFNLVPYEKLRYQMIRRCTNLIWKVHAPPRVNSSCFQSNFPPHPVVLHLSIKQVSARREGFDRCYCAHCHLYPSRLHPRNIRRLKIDCRAPRHPKIDHGPEGHDRPRRHVASGAGGEDCQVSRDLYFRRNNQMFCKGASINDF